MIVHAEQSIACGGLRSNILYQNSSSIPKTKKTLTAKFANKREVTQMALLSVLGEPFLANFAVKSFFAFCRGSRNYRLDESCWKFAAKKRLDVHPTANVTMDPIITHQVQGICVPSHKYESTPKPQSIPTIAPR
jgi:hypothetical protein